MLTSVLLVTFSLPVFHETLVDSGTRVPASLSTVLRVSVCPSGILLSLGTFTTGVVPGVPEHPQRATQAETSRASRSFRGSARRGVEGLTRGREKHRNSERRQACGPRRDVLQRATHGASGRFTRSRLDRIKLREEEGLFFLCRFAA